MLRFLSILTLLILPLCALSAPMQIADYFSTLQSLSADFSQTVYGEQGQPLEQASGRMYMQRPRRFRWEYVAPYKQLVVADGERVWLYDQSLEQITVRPLADAVGSTPLALLSGDEPLDQVFEVDELPAQGPLSWYELRPRQPQAELELLRVAFAAGQIRILEMQDALQRRTRIALANVERNPSLDPALFRFSPPPGVDMIGITP